MNVDRIADLRRIVSSKTVTKGQASLAARECLDEIEHLSKIVDEHGTVRLKNFEGTETTFSGTMVSPFFRDFAAMMHEQFVLSGGLNYVSFELVHKPDDGRWVTYELMLQKKSGETPADQNGRLRRSIRPMRDMLMEVGMIEIPDDLRERYPQIQDALNRALTLGRKASHELAREIGQEPAPHSPLAISALLGSLVALHPDATGVLEQIHAVLLDMTGQEITFNDVIWDESRSQWTFIPKRAEGSAT